MTLYEASNDPMVSTLSAKIKRRAWTTFAIWVATQHVWKSTFTHRIYAITPEDAMADDWELVENKHE